MHRREAILILSISLLSLLIIPLDMEIAEAVFSWRTPIMDTFMIYYTTYGNYIFALAEGMILLASKNKKFRYYLYLVLNSYFGWFVADRLVVAIKNIIRRPRPYVANPAITALAPVGGFSFPSGHSSAAWALATPFIVTTRSRITRFLLILFAVLMSFSRVYCGAHFVSDVIFGGCIGYIISKQIYDNITAEKLMLNKE